MYDQTNTHTDSISLMISPKYFYHILYNHTVSVCEENKMKHFISEIGCKFKL